MLYHLFDYLNEHMNVPGAGVFQYISFRSLAAVITSLIISLIFGKTIIRILQKHQIKDEVRKLGLEGEDIKAGTPTMGGLIILASILIPTLLFGDLTNIYVILMIITTVFLGFLGFMDDYIKVYKKNKKGLPAKAKVFGQISLGLVVGLTLYMSPTVVMQPEVSEKQRQQIMVQNEMQEVSLADLELPKGEKSTVTTIPFLKNNEFDYAWLVAFMGKDAVEWMKWVVFVLLVVLIVTAVSNGANMTDGLDGLATGVSAIIGVTLGVLAYLSGNIIYADYLNIMYIPLSAELVIFMSAFIGATIGFMWYNSYPAQVFMGDTGSLALGGIIAVFAIVIRKELLIPVLCGIFFIENLSVLIQVSWFKYTRKKYGEGRRVFRMAPIHHHYQKLGFPEAKIVTRFWIVGIMLAVFTIITLKLR